MPQSGLKQSVRFYLTITTEDELIKDLYHAVSLNTPTIDFYPINNLVTQISLHKAFKKNSLKAKSGLSKMAMNVLINEFMRGFGYLPHNGHGYVKATDSEIIKRPVVTNKYTFRYHECIYGYSDHDIIGFGSAAVSVLRRFTISNNYTRDKYIKEILINNRVDMDIREHDSVLDESRGIVLHLPYHGYAEKSRIDIDNIHPETKVALEEALKANLIYENNNFYKLTQLGWYWYVNLLYYLSPKNEQNTLDKFIQEKASEKMRELDQCDVSLSF